MSAADPLLQPFRLKHLTFKNRVMSTAHAPNYVEDGLPRQRYQLYHEEKAKGGLALTMFGGCVQHRPRQPGLVRPDRSWSRPDGPGPAGVRRAHPRPWLRLDDPDHPCRAAHPLGHRRLAAHRLGLALARAPAPLLPQGARGRGHPPHPQGLRGDAALAGEGGRARRGGDDCSTPPAPPVLVAGHEPAHRRLRRQPRQPHPLHAWRCSRPSAEGRARLHRRHPHVGDEMLEGGLAPRRAWRSPSATPSAGLIDFFNVIGADATTDLGISKLIPTMGQRTAPILEHARAIKRATGLPVFHATRITDPSTARHVIAEGFADMVGMTRAHIADPHIVAKMMRGEEDRIRPCVGAGYCIDRIYVGGDALCIHNPATGREATMPHVIRPRRRAEAARRGDRRRAGRAGGGAGIGARGHEVTLLEATDRLGGQVNLAARLDRRREILGITGWLQREVELAGVEVRLNSYAESEDVLALEPDIVVVATGGTPNTGFFGEGERSRRQRLGRAVGADGALGRGAGLRRERPAPGAERGRVPGRARRQGDLRGAGPDAGGRAGGHQLGAVHEGALRERRAVRAGPGARGVRREGNRLVATFKNMYTERREERPPTTSWSSTAPCRRTSSTTRSRRLAQPWRDRPRCPAGRPAAGDRRQPGRALPAVPGRRRGGQPQHPRRDLRHSLRLCKDF